MATEQLSLGVIVPDLGYVGGAERLALECLRRWQDRHRITLYSRGFDADALARHGVGDGVARRRLLRLTREPLAGYPWRLLEAWAGPKAWSRQLGDHDVYLAHQWPAHRIEARPLVWYAHELDRLFRDLRREQPDAAVRNDASHLLEDEDHLPADLRHDVMSELLNALDADASPDRIVANSQLTAATLAETFARDDVEVVYPGVDVDAFLPPRFDEPLFLCVGNLHAHKRARLAIEAVSLVPGARLLLVGRGPEQARLERMLAVLGVEDRVEIRTDVDDAELRRLYAACRGVIFVPVNEPFGMVALETLAAGKPLVAVDEGGFTECVDASCAMLTPAEPAALAEALRVLVARPDEARRLGEAGRKIARTFSWDRTADALEAVLLEVHGAHGARARRTTTPAAAPPRPVPEIGVRLLCDYGDGLSHGAWREARPGMPRAGYYASHQASTLRRQLAEIGRAGFDFVTLSLPFDEWGQIARGGTTLRNALALAPELGPAARFAVELVLDTPTRDGLRRVLDWLARTCRGHEPALVCRDGRPLVLLRPRAGAGSPPETLPDHEALWLVGAGEPHGSGAIRFVEAAEGTPWGDDLRAACAGSAPPERVIVASWNDHAACTALEPTVREGERRLEEARAILAALPDRAPR